MSVPQAAVPSQLSPTKQRQRIPDIRFHLPYERLHRRKAFGDALRRLIKEESVLRLDNFALFDAVAKRGGFEAVGRSGRWEQVGACLQYEKKLWGCQKYYQQVLLAAEEELVAECGWYGSVLEGETLEMHLLPPGNLTANYYQLAARQQAFAESYFFSLDEYFNIKTLVLSPADLTKIPQEYADKFLGLRKWLLLGGQVRVSVKEARLLGLGERTERVVVVGLSLGALLLADRLSELGVPVVIVDKGRREARLRDEFQVVENGVMLLEDAGCRTGYARSLEQSSVLLGEVALPAHGMLVLDEQGKPYAEQRIRLSEQHFFGILQQLRGQVMSRKNLYEQVVTRMLRRKLDHERFLIRWHYDRYMTFNRIKGDSTAVADLAAYDAKRTPRDLVHTHSLAVVLSVEKLLARVRERKNVSLVQQQVEGVSRAGEGWTVQARGQAVGARFVVYADQEAVFRSVLDGSPRVGEMGAEAMGETALLLQQLTVMKYINCLFRFREKLLLREPLKNQTCFSICCAHGFVYFFVLNSGTEIMAVLKCYHTSNINYYSEILAILESKCLVKNNRLVNQELFAYEYTFGLKDEKLLEAAARAKRSERLNLLLPITTTACPHRASALLDLTNHLAASILEEIHPNYQTFDGSLREQFRGKEARRGERRKREKEGSATSLPNFPSGRTLSEEQAKIKVITLSTQPADTPSRTEEGQAAPAQEDWFGLKHTIVRGHEQFIKSRVESSGKWRQALCGVSGLALSNPVQLYPGLQLVSLGGVWASEQEWFGSVLRGASAAHLFALHGLTTRREGVSLSNPLRTTIYFQMVLLVDREPYFVIIDEHHTHLRFFHKSLSTLQQSFNKWLEMIKIEELGGRSAAKIVRCRFEPQPPSELLVSSIEHALREELAEIKDTPLTEVLEKKLQQAVEMERENPFMSSDSPPPAPSAPAPSPQQIYVQIAEYLSHLTFLYELHAFTPFQVFFGVLSEQHMACSVMRRASGSPLTYFDLEKLDEPLCKEIQEVFSRDVPNALYGLLLAPEDASLQAHRNFLHPGNRRALYRYTYVRQLEPTGRMVHFLLEGGQRSELGDPREAMVALIGSLLGLYGQEQIIDHFQRLFSLEVEAEGSLSPRLKAFYRMTKKNLAEPPPASSINKFADKCRPLTEDQKGSIYALMKRGRVRWVNGQMILVHK